MAIDISNSDIALFQSQDRLELLNDIDKFRQHGLANLPQIVVCGDTSSGKSSVLEALSGIPFPTDSTLCTRFATEIALRYSSDETVTGEASISPGPHASERHKEDVKGFKQTVTSLDTVPQILRDAQQAMGVGDDRGISQDVLHLKLRGRPLPNLTLVDLPGLIQAARDSSDIKSTKELTKHYFEQKESLIMVIVSAENHYVNQGILTLAREFDPQGERSFGVITKPDILQRPDRIRSTPDILELAKNQRQGFTFNRPWQIMRCLTDDERQRGANRDQIEMDLFSRDPWDTFDRKRLGTKSLRLVLCEYLQEHILRSLPELIKSLEARIASVKSSLQELGPHRATQEERMQYLIRISRRYGQIVRAALNGDYSDTFFHESDTGKRLRAKTMALTDDFEQAMRTRGHLFEVGHFRSPHRPSDEPEVLSMIDALTKVGKLMEGHRGPELSLLFNPRLIAELFKEQSQKWPDLALGYTAAICSAVQVFLRKIVKSICPSPGDTGELILRDIFQDAIHNSQTKLNLKIQELFAPHTTLFLFSTNKRIQSALKAVQSANEVWAKPNMLPSGMVTLSYTDFGIPHSEQDTRLKALQISRAYYNISLETFIDNVVVLGVESCLLSKLEEMFSPETVAQMTEDKLRLLGGETPDIIAERTNLMRRLEMLEAALKNCNRHASREFRLESPFPRSVGVSHGVRLENNRPEPTVTDPARTTTQIQPDSSGPMNREQEASSTPALAVPFQIAIRPSTGDQSPDQPPAPTTPLRTVSGPSSEVQDASPSPGPTTPTVKVVEPMTQPIKTSGELEPKMTPEAISGSTLKRSGSPLNTNSVAQSQPYNPFTPTSTSRSPSSTRTLTSNATNVTPSSAGSRSGATKSKYKVRLPDASPPTGFSFGSSTSQNTVSDSAAPSGFLFGSTTSKSTLSDAPAFGPSSGGFGSGGSSTSGGRLFESSTGSPGHDQATSFGTRETTVSREGSKSPRPDGASSPFDKSS